MKYEDILKESRAVNENNDCAIIALSLFLDRPYNEILSLAYTFGRKQKKGTPWKVIWKILKHYNAKVKYYSKHSPEYKEYKEFIGATTKNLLARHVDKRFAAWFGDRVMIHYWGHLATAINGKLEDSSKNSSKRIFEIIVFDEENK